MADQQAAQDGNQVDALIAHSGTAGTAETVRVVATNGALHTGIYDSGGTQIDAFGAIPVTTYVNTAVALATASTAYLLPGTEQADRKSVVLYNKSNVDVYIGGSAVTTSTGVLLSSGDMIAIDAASGVYGVSGTTTGTINVLEMK